jgi:hypothetical protein
MSQPRSTLMERFLDPATSLAEVMFGLIMTLTFTLGAGVVIEDDGREGVREMLVAVIGCNIAWGIIDAALYLVNTSFERGRLRRLGHSIRHARDEATAVAAVANALDDVLDGAIAPTERERLYERVAGYVRTKPAAATAGWSKEDFVGAFTSFWLVTLTSAPAALPFLVIDDLRVALRVSNGILLALLFLTGYWSAKFTLGNPWKVGLIFLVGGALLVAIAIPLGG